MFKREELMERRERMTKRRQEIEQQAQQELSQLERRQRQIIESANHDIGVIDGQVALLNEMLGKLGPTVAEEADEAPPPMAVSEG